LVALVVDCSKYAPGVPSFDRRDAEMGMEITGIETYRVWGGERNLLFVVVDTDEGIYGVGEAGLTGCELTVTGAIEHFKPLLLGENPFRSEHLWQLHFRGVSSPPGTPLRRRSRPWT